MASTDLNDLAEVCMMAVPMEGADIHQPQQQPPHQKFGRVLLWVSRTDDDSCKWFHVEATK